MGARIYLDDRAYPTDETEAVYFADLLGRLASRPGIAAAGACTSLPVDPATIDFDVHYELPGNPPPADLPPPSADFRVATPEYFAALGIPLVAGRDFDSRDSGDSLPEAIINETLARIA